MDKSLFVWMDGVLTFKDGALTTVEGYLWPAGLARLSLGRNRITSLKGIPPGVINLDLGRNRICSLKHIPPSVTFLSLGTNRITNLNRLPPDLIYLSTGHCSIKSLRIPPSLKELHLGFTSLVVPLPILPPGLRVLHLGWTDVPGLPDRLPADLICLHLGLNPASSSEFASLRTAAYCDVLEYVQSEVDTQEEEFQELQRAVEVPVNKRPARVVLVVLSSSSVPRVGTRAAVRRLHRADLVREMAGMLG